MKRLRTMSFHAQASDEDLKKIDKAIFKLSTALMGESPIEGSDDDDYDIF